MNIGIMNTGIQFKFKNSELVPNTSQILETKIQNSLKNLMFIGPCIILKVE